MGVSRLWWLDVYHILDIVVESQDDFSLPDDGLKSPQPIIFQNLLMIKKL